MARAPGNGRSAADHLSRDGYALLTGADLGAFADRAAHGLAAAASDLPPDPYCDGTFRFRRYARLFILPWAELLVTAPTRQDDRIGAVQMYRQPEALNEEEGGAERWFPAVDQKTLSTDWMDQIIRYDFDQLAFSDAELAAPIQVGIHLVELRPAAGTPATASPACVHRDGEHYTCAHLIERDGVTGGTNHIVDPEWAGSPIEDVPPDAIIAAFTLERPLDGYIVRDDRVAHHVDAVHLEAGAANGARKTLLIDFTPMRPATLMTADH